MLRPKVMNRKHARTSRLRGPQLENQRVVCYHFIFPFRLYCYSHESESESPLLPMCTYLGSLHHPLFCCLYSYMTTINSAMEHRRSVPRSGHPLLPCSSHSWTDEFVLLGSHLMDQVTRPLYPAFPGQSHGAAIRCCNGAAIRVLVQELLVKYMTFT
jgi:hypothetical protein